MAFESNDFAALCFGALAAAALALCATPQASAQNAHEVRLQAAPQVTGEVILLGDVLSVAGDGAAAILARAPAPGGSVALEPAFVAAVAARNGVAWANPEGAPTVTVERLGAEVSADQVIAAIEAWLAGAEGGRWRVTLSSERDFYAPLGEPVSPIVLGLERAPRTGDFEAEIRLSATSALMRINGHAAQALETPVLARPVTRGAVLTLDDLVWVDLPARETPADAVTDPADIIGMAARRSLRSGQPLRSFDLVRPAAIHRGESVMLVYQTGALRLTARGRALADAAEGEVARVVNTDSNRTIEAVVIGPGLVSVSQGSR